MILIGSKLLYIKSLCVCSVCVCVCVCVYMILKAPPSYSDTFIISIISSSAVLPV